MHFAIAPQCILQRYYHCNVSKRGPKQYEQNAVTLIAVGFLMAVFKIIYVLAANDALHTTYIQAHSPAHAALKLAKRFPSEPPEILVRSIEEQHGEFVIGEEERVL